jgi:hypothetical protein
MRVYRGQFHYDLEFEENATINAIKKVDRGKILFIFARIEYLVNQLIIVNILGFLSEKVLLLDDILLYLDLFSRIRILRNYDILNDREASDIMELKHVRNGLAHTWLESEVGYKGKPLNESKNIKKIFFVQ